MREYIKKPENQSRTLDSNPKASRQAPIDVILQRYKERNIQRFTDDEELIQSKFDTAQREKIDEEELLQGKFATSTTQREEIPSEGGETNLAGMPDNLKSGIESLSGYSMDDVRMHYNSSKPAQLQALAYAQGSDIHIAPGQEQHLPHEAWHVVQQKQGRVQPTMQLQGVNVNDNEGLEKEADVMGEKAFSLESHKNKQYTKSTQTGSTIQRKIIIGGEEGKKESDEGDGDAPLSASASTASSDSTVEPQPLWDEIKKNDNITLHFTTKANACEKVKNDQENVLIDQPAYATGDQFALAAAMKMDNRNHVAISDTRKGKIDSSGSILGFYRECGLLDSVFRVAKRIQKTCILYGGLVHTSGPFDEGTKYKIISKKNLQPIGYGTKYIAKKWSDDSKGKVRNMWVPEDPNKDNGIEAWLASKGITGGGKVAVLWSRFSGKKGGAHIEHDTSYQAIRRMIWIAHYQEFDTVLIVGDAASGESHKNKYPLMAEVATELGVKTYDLTEFWKDNSVEAWGGKTRLGQLYFYDFLDRKFESLKHIGSRSGNLEAMALLGHETRYLEEPESEGGQRMEQWHKAKELEEPEKTKTGGKAPGYERILIDAPLTRTGKKAKEQALRLRKLKEQEELEKRKGIEIRKKELQAQVSQVGLSKEKYSRGLTEADADKIRDFFHT